MRRNRFEAPPEPPPDFDDAVRGYRSFQALDPRDIGVFHGLKIPARLRLCGEAVHVLYRSDKWGEGEHDYIHEHEGGVHAYRPDGEGEKIEVPRSVRGAGTLYLLGFCQGFRYRDGDDLVDAKVRKPLPELYTTPDGKALLVIETHLRPARLAACIWGGGLDVKDVGIVG